MTPEENVALLKEAGIWDVIGFPDCIDKLIAIVAAHWQKIHEQEMSMMSELCADRILEEREACAKVCEERLEIPMLDDAHKMEIQLCAAAIRARGEA